MTYPIQYAAAWVVFVIGAIAGILAGVGYTGLHPAWLTPDIAATAGIVSAACVLLAGALPQIGRTPATREAKYLAAMAGAPPDDIVKKHALNVVQQPSGSLIVTSPEQPLPH